MKRPLTTLVLSAGLVLTAGCSEDPTGDSVTENPADEAPGQEKDKLEETPTPSP